MTRRASPRSRIGAILLALAVAACGSSSVPPTPAATAVPTPLAQASPSPVPTPSATPNTTPSATVTPDPALPPDATLTVEGGDPVTGQLGSFNWGDGGSDSGTLPGSPISASPREPLTVGLSQPVGVSSWSAVMTRTDTTGTPPLGVDVGPPPMSLTVPQAGTWRVVVTMRFADNAGSATYTWRLTVVP